MATNDSRAEKPTEPSRIDIDISAEELAARLQQQSSTPSDERPTCPDCGGISLSPRHPHKCHRGGVDGGYPYYCEVCEQGVEPVEGE
jgi:hypothetical protein